MTWISHYWWVGMLIFAVGCIGWRLWWALHPKSVEFDFGELGDHYASRQSHEPPHGGRRENKIDHVR